MASSPAATPEERVSAFIADYARAHAQVAPLFEESRESRRKKGIDAFKIWGQRLAQVHAAHYLKPSSVGAISFGSDPELSPDTVTITRIERYGTYARVSMTRDGSAIGGSHLEADVWLVDGDWRMESVQDYEVDPSTPLRSESDLTALMTDARQLPPFCERTEDPCPDPGAFFRDGWARETLFYEGGGVWEEIWPGEEDDPEFGTEARARALAEVPIYRTEVLDLGVFFHTGRLVIGESGRPTEVEMCALELPAGPARTQVLLAHDEDGSTISTALRVVLDTQEEPVVQPHAWKGARLVPGSATRNIIDAGTVLLADARSFFSLSQREWMRSACVPPGPEHALVRDGGGTAIGAVSVSGWGAGIYEAAWGLAEDGRPLQLLIDFGILREPVAGPRTPRTTDDAGSRTSS